MKQKHKDMIFYTAFFLIWAGSIYLAWHAWGWFIRFHAGC